MLFIQGELAVIKQRGRAFRTLTRVLLRRRDNTPGWNYSRAHTATKGGRAFLSFFFPRSENFPNVAICDSSRFRDGASLKILLDLRKHYYIPLSGKKISLA